MSNVRDLPLVHDAMSDEDIAHHTARAAGKLLAENVGLVAENVNLMVEAACYRSAWISVSRRLEALETRRLQWLIAGSIVGALVGWTVDGSFAQVLDHLLTRLGWLS